MQNESFFKQVSGFPINKFLLVNDNEVIIRLTPSILAI
jgi:hypothetical protein